MAAQKGILANALVEVATESGNAIAFLRALISGRFTRVNQGSGRVTISTSQPGASASWTIPAGFSDLEIIEIAHIALNIVRTNVNAAPTYSADGAMITNPIDALPPSEQGVTYGVFTSIAR